MEDTIHNRVAEVRREHGISQEDLASKVDVSRQTIIALEKGNYFPSLLLALRIARLFNLDLKDLVSLKGHNESTTE